MYFYSIHLPFNPLHLILNLVGWMCFSIIVKFCIFDLYLHVCPCENSIQKFLQTIIKIKKKDATYSILEIELLTFPIQQSKATEGLCSRIQRESIGYNNVLIYGYQSKQFLWISTYERERTDHPSLDVCLMMMHLVHIR